MGRPKIVFTQPRPVADLRHVSRNAYVNRTGAYLIGDITIPREGDSLMWLNL